MKVAEILKDRGGHVFTIRTDQTILQAVHVLVDHNIGSLLVEDGEGNIAGILTERDILRECARRYEAIGETLVGEVMTHNPVMATPDDDIRQVQALMTENRIRHLPITIGGRVVGLVSIGDVVKVLHHEAELENRDLKDYISGKYLGV